MRHIGGKGGPNHWLRSQKVYSVFFFARRYPAASEESGANGGAASAALIWKEQAVRAPHPVLLDYFKAASQAPQLTARPRAALYFTIEQEPHITQSVFITSNYDY